MTWLIDTNIISEVRKGPRCHPAVAAWWAGVEDRDLFLSALTLGEIRKGVEGIRPRDPAKAAALEGWLAEVAEAFGPRVLDVDTAVAEAWGRMSALRSVPVVDALLAATARVHDLVLVTRNTTDVEGLGVRVLNPFESASS
ncbi:type II toxin-antitoxin system VapC family toxin [Caldovatus sediminis]|uniref:type II toxin-antitoxin system VapC family toxin n=1 Tax=Caldovatus sediminis TaxID=2041189 RepID=UPI00166DDCE9|nr:type II toxin-antitoxin system VapC family toxin [Caldovatus sediminis]